MIWYVAIGSAVGGVSRFLLQELWLRWAGSSFPVGTLVVNVTGCFLIGVLARHALGAPSLTPEMRALLAIGFCGGYTTFSTFSAETLTLLQHGAAGRAGLYVALSVLASLAATAIGMRTGR